MGARLSCRQSRSKAFAPAIVLNLVLNARGFAIELLLGEAILKQRVVFRVNLDHSQRDNLAIADYANVFAPDGLPGELCEIAASFGQRQRLHRDVIASFLCAHHRFWRTIAKTDGCVGLCVHLMSYIHLAKVLSTCSTH